MSKIYKKWREAEIDLNKLNLDINKIISYPPAGNDVFEILYENKNVFLKVERSKMANFKTEYENINKIKSYYKKIPTILKYGDIDKKKYIMLSKIEGERLSDLIVENKIDSISSYRLYGKELALIHQIPIDNFEVSKKRIINDIISFDIYKEKDDFLLKIYDYLERERTYFNDDTFIHGDFHYANILWLDGKINGVLDFEYSGKGFKEQDIAWSLIPRPSQCYEINKDIIISFLEGYNEIGNFNYKNFLWCFINGCAHFYLMNFKNQEYKSKLQNLMVELLIENN